MSVRARRSCLVVLVFLAAILVFPLFAQIPSQPPPVNAKLAHHSNYFVPTVYKIRDDPYSKPYWPNGLNYTAYVAVGYDLANTLAIVGPTGEIVIIDTLGDQGSVNYAISAFRSAGAFPMTGSLNIRAIIYTHNHIDHIGGVQSYANAAAAAQGGTCAPESESSAGSDSPLNADSLNCISILGQKNIVQGVNNTATVIGTAINNRSAYMYGSFLPVMPQPWVVNDGIGPQVNKGTSSWIPPSHTFTNSMTLTAAGVNMQLVYVPSETDDELMVFIPDAKNGGKGDSGLLLSAEVIQGPSFPNLYSLRGTSYRNPATWFRSVDTLRSYDAWCMLPSHGTPLCGATNIQNLLVNFRDAIQYTHDQSVRLMNLGFTSAELTDLMPMPQYLLSNLQSVQTERGNALTNPEDYLTFFYGSIPQAVREMYFGYLGWYQGDPVALAPTPPTDYAARVVKMMGGRAAVLAAANDAYNKREYQWSAELATLLVSMDPKATDGRGAKANAFWKLAGLVTNPNWRNWYITAALELQNESTTPKPAIVGGLTSPGIVKAVPFADWVNQWTFRLKAEETIKANANTSLGIWFVPAFTTQKASGYVMTIRKAVCQIKATTDIAVVQAADNAIQVTRAAADQLIDADVPHAKPNFTDALASLMQNRTIPVLHGTQAGVSAFFATTNFDAAPERFPAIAGR